MAWRHDRPTRLGAPGKPRESWRPSALPRCRRLGVRGHAPRCTGFVKRLMMTLSTVRADSAGRGDIRTVFHWTTARKRDAYIGLVTFGAAALFLEAVTHRTPEPWNVLSIFVLFVAMLAAERMSVPLPKQAAISIASIPHTIALLLLPVWLA